MALSVQPIRLPVAKAPDSEQTQAIADGPLHSIAETGVLLQSLRQSRHAIVSSIFTPFSTIKKRPKDAFKPPPPHTTVNLGKCTVEIGPHTFAYTTFHEIVYSAAPPTAGSSGSGSPVTQLKLGTGDVASQTVFSALDPTVRSTLTPDLIDKVNLAAATNPTLAQLLRATATRQASKEQEKTLGVLIQSLARGPAQLSQLPLPPTPTQSSLVDAPVPVKRGPGRPPKVTPSPFNASLPVADAGSSTSSPPPVKRGPGRPPKPKPVVFADESTQADPAPVKRGPGRPPKPVAIDGEVSAQANSAPVKRGPGRPPKPKPIPIPPSDDEGESEGGSTAHAPAKRGPGRPPRSQPVDPESDGENESEALPPVKRGPGRPPKPKPPPSESNGDDNDDDDEGDSEAAPPPIKRGPGRPPKPKPNGDATIVKRGPGRPPKVKPALGSEADATPPVKRGPGRPPKPKAVVADEDKDGTSDAGPSIRRSGRFSTASLRPLKELSSSEPESDSSSEGEEAPPPVKRGPGRPPKPKPPPPSSAPELKETDADSGVAPPVKRGPGRPPKPKPELSSTPAAGQNLASEPGVTPPVKRGPGRPPKPKPPVIDIAPEYASAAPLSAPAAALPPGPASVAVPAPAPIVSVLRPSTQETPMDIDPPVAVPQKQPIQQSMEAGPSTPSTSKPRTHAGGPTGNPDIAFEFYENKDVRFLLPKEPVLYTITDTEICLTTTIEVKVTLPAPALPAAAPAAPGESQEPPAPPPPPPTRVGYQVLRIRLKNVPDKLRTLLETRAADKAQTSQAKKTFKIQKAAAAPRVHLQFRLPDGPVLEQVQAAAFAGPPTKPLQPPATIPPPKRKRRANASAAPGEGVKRRRTAIRACAGCNKTSVPIMKDSKFCRECGDSDKAVNTPVASANTIAGAKEKVEEPTAHKDKQSATVESQVIQGPQPAGSIVEERRVRADSIVGST